MKGTTVEATIAIPIALKRRRQEACERHSRFDATGDSNGCPLLVAAFQRQIPLHPILIRHLATCSTPSWSSHKDTQKCPCPPLASPGNPSPIVCNRLQRKLIVSTACNRVEKWCTQRSYIQQKHCMQSCYTPKKSVPKYHRAGTPSLAHAELHCTADTSRWNMAGWLCMRNAFNNSADALGQGHFLQSCSHRFGP